MISRMRILSFRGNFDTRMDIPVLEPQFSCRSIIVSLEKLYPCAISPSPVCSHGGMAARGPEGTKPGYGWLHTSLGRMAAGWAAEAATGSAIEDWDADSDLVSRAESSALERVAEAGERTSRLFRNVRECKGNR